MRAMLFAAGLGTRLQAVTANRPKALVEVAGKPLLEHAVNYLIVVPTLAYNPSLLIYFYDIRIVITS